MSEAEFDPSEYIKRAAAAKQGVERGDRIKAGSGVLAVTCLFFKRPRLGGALFFAEHEQMSAENPAEPTFEVDANGKITDRPLVQRKNGTKITICEDLQSEYGPAKMANYFRKLLGLPMNGQDEIVDAVIKQYTDRAPGKFNLDGKLIQPARGMLIGYEAKQSTATEGKHNGKTFTNVFYRSIDQDAGNTPALINERRAKLGGDAPIPVQEEKKK